MAEFLLSILAGTTHDHSTVSVGPEVHELVMGSLILTVSDFDSDTQSPLRRGSREEWVVCWQRNGLFRTRFGPRLTSQSLILESETKKQLLPIDKCHRVVHPAMSIRSTSIVIVIALLRDLVTTCSGLHRDSSINARPVTMMHSIGEGKDEIQVTSQEGRIGRIENYIPTTYIDSKVDGRRKFLFNHRVHKKLHCRCRQRSRPL